MMRWLLLVLIGCGSGDHVRTETYLSGVCKEDDSTLRASLHNGTATIGCEQYLSWDCEVELVGDTLLLNAEVVIDRRGKDWCTDGLEISPVLCEVPDEVDWESHVVVMGSGHELPLADVWLCRPE